MCLASFLQILSRNKNSASRSLRSNLDINYSFCLYNHFKFPALDGTPKTQGQKRGKPWTSLVFLAQLRKVLLASTLRKLNDLSKMRIGMSTKRLKIRDYGGTHFTDVSSLNSIKDILC